MGSKIWNFAVTSFMHDPYCKIHVAAIQLCTKLYSQFVFSIVGKYLHCTSFSQPDAERRLTLIGVKALQLLFSVFTYQNHHFLVTNISRLHSKVVYLHFKVVIMKHDIKHHVNIDGINYVSLTEGYIKDVIDFFFDVFLRGKSCITIISSRKKIMESKDKKNQNDFLRI